MIRKNINVASFTGTNDGQIKDCYANVKSNLKNIAFCKTNNGTIERGLLVKETVKLEQSKPLLEETKRYFQISTKEQLLEIQEKINAGDEDYQKKNYQLCNDIDLKGISWIPIGKSENTPFKGTFDGNGHAIQNMCAVAQKNTPCGFFGILDEASITNLHIIGRATGGSFTGLLAGQSKRSTISNCSANGKVKGAAYAGMLLGQNSGTITQCYVEGSLLTRSCTPFLIASAATFIILVSAAAIFTKKPASNTATTYFPPIPVDNHAIQIDHKRPKTGKHSISCGFDSSLIVDENGETSLHFKNPGESNQHVIVTIQLTDEELLNKIGKTGRTKKELKKLKKDKNYDTKTARVEIAKSGTIPPGYELKTLPLSNLPDGTALPKGTYNAIVFLTFYDIFTNQQAMLKSQSFVSLVVN